MIRKPCPLVCDELRKGKKIEDFDLEFVVPCPTELIYKFEGTVHIIKHDEIFKRIPIDYDNTMWGGCKIAKGSMTALVIYNGKDSKLMMNLIESEPKRSLVVDELNTYSKILFFLMLLASIAILYMKGSTNRIVIQLFRYVLLLGTIIPISMKVNHDIARLYYSYRINNDKDIPNCQARNSNVCEDLGRIEFFLTDKTGTLTKNIMIMRKIYINGTKDVLDEKQFKAHLNHLRESKRETDETQNFVNCMMVCHAVSPATNDEGVRILESASPDEISFIQFMEGEKFLLMDKTDQSVTFRDETGEQHDFQILLSFPFTSERKRMGVICRREGDSDYTFFLKGADSIMMNKIVQNSQETMMSYVEELSSKGLRALALATRKIPKGEYEQWKKEYDSASASLKNRTNKVEACIEKLEHEMQFVGVDFFDQDYSC